MSRKLVLAPIIIANNQSLTSSFNSAATILDFQDNVLYEIDVTTNNSAGTFKVQVSQDYQPSGVVNVTANAGTWVDLALDGVPTVASASDNILISLNQVPFHAMRLAYTSTTPGTGTCKIIITARNIGS